MSIKKDKYYISLANNLALNSNGYTGLNPSVGVVVVKNDNVISFGSTGFTGIPHAEVDALNKLSKNEKKNSTIYISLEPCSHFGKTPPCVNKIIDSKIKRVVYSINDVDIRTSKKADKILKSKRIKVKNQLLKKISKTIYKNYFYSKKKKIPYVYGKLAISKDFYIKDKKNFYITNNYSLKTSHILRSKVNCIVASSKTINEDNPKLNCRINGLNKFSPYVAILDKNLNIKNKSFLVLNAKNIKTYLFYNKINKNKIKFLKSRKLRLIYSPLKNKKLDFNFILKKLYKLGISSVLIEGGKTLTISLLNRNFFNEFYLFISSQKLKKKGLLKVMNIKSKLSMKFKNIKYNETFLDKDNLIHYY
tara:strand:- start:6701 stop:7786 length:1086 start_codon:yes stop_codon:yes gene_type:complete